MSTPTIPTAEQLAATRAGLWHQNGQPLLTLESLREWINDAGLVLYTRRAQQLPAPAPTVVEAVLGVASAEPTPDEMVQVRGLVARLIAEGSAVPLNLLGSTTDVPDYICSAAVFSYVFTLRGDKAWKQPPATVGAVKVSPLGLATYEAIARRVTLTAAELATELGKEVTEAAVLRGLVELWAQLRVLPVPQQDGAVMWELMSTRLTKQIKAGANAGQPTALSALISLYLAMTVVATEDEIETILSPLAPRSRIRDVVHALMGARQLDTIAIDGRTVVYLAGALPVFAAGDAAAAEQGEAGASLEAVGAEAVGTEAGGAEARISKFVPRPKKVGTGYAKRFTPLPGAERERRPFQKKSFGAPVKPSFTRPWEEKRPAPPTGEGVGAAETPRAERPGFDRPKRAGFAGKPAFGGKPRFGERSGATGNDGGMRPPFRRTDARDAGGDRPRGQYTPRASEAGESRGPRKAFGSKPGFGAKPAFGGKPAFGNKPAYGGSEGLGGKPSFGGKPSMGGRREQGARRDEGGTRPAYGGTGDARPPRKEFPGAPGGGLRPGGERRPGSYSARPQAGGSGFVARKPPFAGKAGGRPDFAPDRGNEGSGPETPRKVFRKFDAPRSEQRSFDKGGAAKGSFDRPRRPFASDGPARPSFGNRPQGAGPAGKPGGFAGKKPFSKAGSKPPGTFAKFADGAQPFRRPFAGKPGGKSFGDKGAGPTFRKRKPAGGESA